MKLESDVAKDKSKLVFDCEDARFRLQHAQKELEQANLERDNALKYADEVK